MAESKDIQTASNPSIKTPLNLDLEDFDFAELDNLDDEIDEETRKKMELMYETSMKNFREGEIVRGSVVEITNDSVIVDIGFKSEGAIELAEFPNKGRDLQVGEEVDVYLEKTEDNDGQVVLSKDKANKIRVWEEMALYYDDEKVIQGTILSKIKGGLTVDIGLKAFLPGSQIDLRPIKNLDKLLGQKFDFRIIKMNRKRGNIVVSRRILLEEERKINKENTLLQLEEGKIVEGIVKNITDYGAFIDLGGMDGLLHITDMSWGRVNHPSELFSVGDIIQVMILKYDKENERVSLGLKQVSKDPWTVVEAKYPVTSRVNGKVVSVTDYGAFVELEEGVEGLVHISEMSWNKHLRHPSKIVAVGDEVEAVVLNIDWQKKRISLGMKQIELNPWENIEEKYPIGSVVEGKVRNLTEFGAFVELEEGIDCLIHISDMSWTQKIRHPSDILKKRDNVQAIVLHVDTKNERLSLGLKQLEPDPWESIGDKYQVGTDVDSQIVKITNFGAFAEIAKGIEGLIHVSQLSSRRVTDPKKVVKVGQDVKAKIIKLDIPNRKIGLSMKAYSEGLDVEDVEAEIQDFPDEPVESEE